MKKKIRRRKCKNCHDLFMPDPCQLKRQIFCTKPEYKTASKMNSQQKWVKKEKDRGYFPGSEHVICVQQWRQENSGYWKRGKLKKYPPYLKMCYKICNRPKALSIYALALL